jgi:predicted kinase
MTNAFIFCGQPGTGKTTLSKLWAKEIKATYIRIDTIEQAIIRTDCLSEKLNDEGYQVAFALAGENLSMNNSIVVDGVNSLKIIRNRWQEITRQNSASIQFIEISCWDKELHQTRIETRNSDIKGHQLPSWFDVCNTTYEPCEPTAHRLDTAHRTIEETYAKLRDSLIPTPT